MLWQWWWWWWPWQKQQPWWNQAAIQNTERHTRSLMVQRSKPFPCTWTQGLWFLPETSELWRMMPSPHGRTSMNTCTSLWWSSNNLNIYNKIFTCSLSLSTASPTMTLCTPLCCQRLAVCCRAAWTQMARKTTTWSRAPSCVRCWCWGASGQQGPVKATTSGWRPASLQWAAPVCDP